MTLQLSNNSSCLGDWSAGPEPWGVSTQRGLCSLSSSGRAGMMESLGDTVHIPQGSPRKVIHRDEPGCSEDVSSSNTAVLRSSLKTRNTPSKPEFKGHGLVLALLFPEVYSSESLESLNVVGDTGHTRNH